MDVLFALMQQYIRTEAADLELDYFIFYRIGGIYSNFGLFDACFDL